MISNGQTIVKRATHDQIQSDDNAYCDIANDTNNHLLLSDRLNGSELNINDRQNYQPAITINMTIPQKSDSLSARRPSAISLKPIVTTSDGEFFLNGNDSTDGCFDGETDALRAEVIGEYRSKGINVSFENIIYQKRCGLCWNRATKTILNGVNGEFRANELSAIMGPSGAGKSSLLDILSGYTTDFTSGSITINDRPRDLKLFRSQAAYIMQDDLLQSHISAWEAMHFSVNLKIGNQLKRNEKKQRIQEILKAIGLFENRYTKTGDFSGGQRKRLAIALELVDNPQFMAFDEPTSGLDSSTSTQVILLLQQLAKEGRTIVCTIHQPSATLFGLFDHLYAMADGRCIYSGATEQLVPFLSELNLICPTTYNPSDYLLEISTHDYGEEHNDRLADKIKNGLNTNYRARASSDIHNQSLAVAERMIQQGLITPVKAPEFAPNLQSASHSSNSYQMSRQLSKIQPIEIEKGKCCMSNGTYATSFCRQWCLLMARTMLCLSRDRSLALSRIIIHICIALLIGTIYFNIGNDAAMMLNNFKYTFITIMFLMFTAFSTMTINFPLELPIVTREHFNRWYSIKAYYFAVTFADLPLQLVCVLLFVIITYLMTAQPLEWFRIGLFFMIMFLVTLVSQGLGMVVGAVCSVEFGVIVGPFTIAPFLVFSGFFLRLADASSYLHWLFHISYLKYALEGASNALFGFNRPKLPCNEMYCHYRIPNKFMKEIDMDHSDLFTVVGVLLAMCFLLRITAFYFMSLRIKRR